jgi:membrane peptidoglycan carboxypeptidase
VRAQTHASVAFGHEIATTLWQHASALSAVVRGRIVPLHLVASVEHEGVAYPVQARAGGDGAFRAATSATVRAMMELGSREGTGRSVYRDGLALASKTGTAQKTATELCLHVLGRAVERAQREGRVLGEAAARALPRRADHERCYTSSMLLVGRHAGLERLVLVVVDEPTGTERYGSKVAGPSALAILAAALGVSAEPEPAAVAPMAAEAPAPPASEQRAAHPFSEPWAEPLDALVARGAAVDALTRPRDVVVADAARVATPVRGAGAAPSPRDAAGGRAAPPSPAPSSKKKGVVR